MAVLVFDLPMCTVHTLTPRGNREGPKSGIYFKIFEKSTIFIEHPVVKFKPIILNILYVTVG